MSASSEDNAVKITALLFAAGAFFGLPLIIGVVVAYIKKGDVRGGYAESIYVYLIYTFWLSILYFTAATILVVLLVGIFLLPIVYIWFLVRVVKAVIAALDGKPINDPRSWLI